MFFFVVKRDFRCLWVQQNLKIQSHSALDKWLHFIEILNEFYPHLLSVCKDYLPYLVRAAKHTRDESCFLPPRCPHTCAMMLHRSPSTSPTEYRQIKVQHQLGDSVALSCRRDILSPHLYEINAAFSEC